MHLQSETDIMLQVSVFQLQEYCLAPSKSSTLNSIREYEKEARRKLNPRLISYIFYGTESETTLERNIRAFSSYALRRRVFQAITLVDTRTSYFHDRMYSSLPFFPSCINVRPMYPTALLDILRISQSFETPIFVSDLNMEPPIELSRLPSLVPKNNPLVWQIYLHKGQEDASFKKAKLAESWGYKGIALTVDVEMGVKVRDGVPSDLVSEEFVSVTTEHLRQLRRATRLPIIAKGIMAAEDAELAIESGADGIVVSNHGGRTLDEGQASLDVLPEIVKHLKSKSATRGAEIFFDGGIRRGTDILKALALGARGCLIGRPLFWGLAVDKRHGPSEVMRILKEEMLRAATLCGVRSTSGVDQSILRKVNS
jgi:isopentenyl diphosphate isomerase/L-lactate dehydrogenase-like FMN-dependent dehydrogenase